MTCSQTNISIILYSAEYQIRDRIWGKRDSRKEDHYHSYWLFLHEILDQVQQRLLVLIYISFFKCHPWSITNTKQQPPLPHIIHEWQVYACTFSSLYIHWKEKTESDACWAFFPYYRYYLQNNVMGYTTVAGHF